ncbi:divergent polysaccharide deacetylase family protein [Maridesulfovibrio sp.]|uniref:divergent polysaccharide deacetylase family protein n=1 Tax=Maridesulfovibrio sp. TaxID=2795000 RepID=UPI002A18A3EA|nr:divergent polysaccharide deacetylase family protein [Maridesulfovibrio sp.]
MENNNHDLNNEPELPEEKPGFRARLFKPLILAAATVVAAACICIIIAMVVSPSGTGDAAGKRPDSPEQSLAENSSAQSPALFEEPDENNLSNLVKRADLTLINLLKSSDISMSELKLEDVSLKKYQGHDFHFQELSFPCKGDKKEFIDRVQAGLLDAGLNATVHEVSADSWLISINGVPTHKFSLLTPAPTAPAPIVTSSNAPKMAIVIDDMGEDLRLAEGLAALERPVTFSIWPNSSHVGRTVKIARKHGIEIMIHLPMQPKGYPKVNPGSDALLVGMSGNKIRMTVNEAVKKVPGAVGLNNHMGSKFTEDYKGMKEVMAALKKHRLFFLDSRTTPDSAGPKAARIAGVTLYERNIFLDNVKDVSAIKYQLSKAAEVARKKGQSIAIGHPHRETLKAIRLWMKENRGRVNIVPVHMLVPKG